MVHSTAQRSAAEVSPEALTQLHSTYSCSSSSECTLAYRPTQLGTAAEPLSDDNAGSANQVEVGMGSANLVGVGSTRAASEGWGAGLCRAPISSFRFCS